MTAVGFLFRLVVVGAFLSAFCAMDVQGARCPESYYVAQFCQDGEVEHVFEDRTRCDCLTDNHAIEVDFARKWYQAIGQSLYYALQSGKRAGVVLILEKQSDYKYWLRLNSTIRYHDLPIDTWKLEGCKIPE